MQFAGMKSGQAELRMKAIPGRLINTPLQWGANGGENCINRFNGFPQADQTVGTVGFTNRPSVTPLRWRVNKNTLSALLRKCVPSRGFRPILGRSGFVVFLLAAF